MHSHFALLTVVLNSHIDLFAAIFAAICWKLMCLILSYLMVYIVFSECTCDWQMCYDNNFIVVWIMTNELIHVLVIKKTSLGISCHLGTWTSWFMALVPCLEFDNKRIQMRLTTLPSKKSRKTDEYVFFITVYPLNLGKWIK